MTSPAVTCASTASLAQAAHLMDQADTGSVVVTEGGKAVGILTERDLLRATAARAVTNAKRCICGLPATRCPRTRRESRRGVEQPDVASLPAPPRRRRR